jgi:hypothetical protein
MADSTLHPDDNALVRCATSKGPVVMEFHRDWSPNGYDRAVSLFEKGLCESWSQSFLSRLSAFSL